MTTLELLSALRARDVKLWSEDGQLRYNAPKGALTPELREQIIVRKAELLAFLEQARTPASDVPSLHAVVSDGPQPLSFAQQRLWLLDQMSPGTALYNIPFALRMHGTLDVSALERALSEIVRRHEVLRVRFSLADEQPVQVAVAPWAVRLTAVDLTALPEAERAATSMRLVDEEGQRPFDLQQGSLLRTMLLRLDQQTHILTITFHHIIADGWSLGVMIRELAVLYDAFSTGASHSLDDLPVQYSNYVHWQRAWIDSAAADAQLAYWKQQLAGSFPTLQLPLDRPRQAMPSYRGASLTASLPAALSRALKALGQQEDATLFMTLLAAFKMVLSRYVEHEDIVVGAPVAGRTQAALEGLIGCFLNTVALRTDLSGNPTFRELLQRVRGMTIGSYAHQDVPFERLLQTIFPNRDLQHAPLFRIFFNMLNFPHEQIQLRNLHIDILLPREIGAKFDLTLYVSERADEIGLELVYNPDLFAQDKMEVLLEQMQYVLQQVVRDPDRSIGRYSLVTPAVQNTLPDPYAPLTRTWTDTCHAAVTRQAQQNPAAIALIDTESEWTYAELDAWSNRIARYLIAHGIQRQELVAIYAHRHAVLVAALLGVLKAGAAFMILDPAYPEARLIAAMEVARPRGWLQLSMAGPLPDQLAAFVDAACICQLELSSGPELEADSLLCAYPPDDPQIVIGPDDLAYVAFTSGSTGHPKAIAGTHRPLTHFLAWHSQTFGFDQEDRFSMVSGLAHDPLLRDVLTPLWVGATLCIPDPEQLGYPGWLAEWMERESISVAHLTPAMIQILAESANPETQLPLRYAFFGGDVLSRHALATLRALAPAVTCVNFYGTTETPQAMGYYRVPDELTAAPMQLDTAADQVAPIPLGSGIADVQLLVLNTEQQLAGIGELGEIYIRTPYLAQGYLNDPAATQERFLINPFTGQAEDRLYRTGDLGRYRPDGHVVFGGRADQQVNIRGFRVELDEIDGWLHTHPAVRDTALVVREDQPGDTQLVAYIVPHPIEWSPGEIHSFLSTKLPSYMLPAAFVVLDTLPLTPNGKLDRQALPAPGQSRAELGPLVTAPRTSTEATLVGIWSEVLNLSGIGIHDNFFELGGHSLLATRIVARVRDTFGVELPLFRLFESATVASLSAWIEDALRAEQSDQDLPLRPVSRSTPPPASFGQQRLWLLHQLEPESAAYNIPTVVRLTGALNTTALQLALNEVVRRHEVLRTTFAVVEEQLVQMIRPAQPITLTTVQLPACAETERMAQIEQFTAAEVTQPFDLMHGPLLRLTLLQLDENDHVLLLVMHHIVVDGWSTEIFIRELASHYDALSHGRPSSLAELPIQYADFAAWQREVLAPGPALETRLAYWREQLKDAPAILDLPTDHPRPAIQTFHGAHYPFLIPQPLADQLRALSLQESATLFMTLLAAFQTLLSRYSGQDDLVVGTPIAGRTRLEVENLIGFFVNTLALRGDLSGQPSFREVVRRVRTITTNAYTHQDLPFEQLVEELQVQRDLSRSPLFQVMFMLQNVPLPTQHLSGITLNLIGIDTKTAQFDLMLVLTEVSKGIAAHFEYNTDLFTAATIGRMSQHFLALLARVVAEPDRPVIHIPLLTESEQQQLIAWNSTATPYPDTSCIHELFAAQAARRPDSIAVAFQDQTLTYRELDRRANSLAHHLQTLGVRRGTLVGISMLRSLDLVVGILGVLKAGGAYLPIDPTYPAARRAMMIEDAQVTLVLTQQSLADQFVTDRVQAVCLDTDRPVISRAPDYDPAVTVSAHDLAYVIYTSGSTGQPKGVMVRHGNVVNFFTGMDQTIGEEQPGVWLSVTSISFDISVLELLWTLARGFQVVIQTHTTQDSVASSPAATRPMAFSLFYFSSDEGQDGDDRYRLLLEGAKFADQHGFAAVWTPERHFHAFGGLYPNPSVVSAALAVLTEHIQIRAGSVVLPLQNPVRVAEEWAVVDNLSKGRVGLSFASGWHANDFVLAPEHFHDRRTIMLREIETVRRLWRGKSVMLKSGLGNEVPVATLPRPLQPELPVWITAAGNAATFRTAGEVGANLLTHLLGQDLDDLKEKIAIYRRAWQEHSHAGNGHVSLMLHTFVGEDLEEVRQKVRRPFGDYLKSSINLWQGLARDMGYDLEAQQFTAEEEEVLLAHAFDRYAETSGLIGTPATCVQTIDRLKAIGVDEVACLIDFGVDTDSVLKSLELLDVVKQHSNQNTAQEDADFSLAAQIQRYQVSHLQCTPSMARMLVAEPETQRALGTLRKLLLGGEELSAALAEQLRSLMTTNAIYNMYGPTETTIWSTVHPLTEAERSVAIGRPIANTTVYILDQMLQPVPVGLTGDLYIGGAGVTSGYLRRPAPTAERFIPDPFSDQVGARLYKTGDLARYRPNGDIDFLGRSDQQIKLSGYRIELGEIEVLLRQHPQIQEAVAVVREDQPGKGYLAAYVVPQRIAQTTLQPALPPAEQQRLLADRRHYTLPNGLVISHMSDLQAAGIYHEIFEDEMYLRYGITLHDHDCVFDVGANIGLFTLFVSQQVKDARVFSFEPIPPTFDALQTNVTLYGVNAKVFRCGLSNHIEHAELTFYPEMAGLSGRYSEPQQDRAATKSMILNGLQDPIMQEQVAELDERDLDDWLDKQFRSERYTCQMRTLSDIVQEYGLERIDLLKIDVEKAELDVLGGIRDEDWPKIQQIVAEVDTQENLSQMLALLDRHGFHVAVDDLVIVEADNQAVSSYVYMLYASRQPLQVGQPITVGHADQARARISSDDQIVNRLRSYLKDRLPAYMLPSVFIVLPTLPLTPNGKIDRRALPVPSGVRGQAETTYVAPKTEVEQAIVDVWRSVLHVEQVGIHDNFFELGGTSLLITQVRAKLRGQLGYDVSLVDLFRYPTVRTLAEYVSQDAPVQRSFDSVRARADKQIAKRQRRGSKG